VKDILMKKFLFLFLRHVLCQDDVPVRGYKYMRICVPGELSKIFNTLQINLGKKTFDERNFDEKL